MSLLVTSHLPASCSFLSLSLSLSLCGGCSPTAPTAPSLRLLVPSSSLIRCEPVQVYHHHPRPRVPLDPVYYEYIINPGDYFVWALPGGLKFRRLLLYADWAIDPEEGMIIVRIAGPFQGLWRRCGKSSQEEMHNLFSDRPFFPLSPRELLPLPALAKIVLLVLVTLKRRYTATRLHGVTSHKTHSEQPQRWKHTHF
jgi:hypothetical protein